MARFHGSTSKVYWGGRDASGDISEIAVTGAADVHEVTNMASAGWHEFDPGLLGYQANVQAFYDPAAGGIGQQWESLLGSTTDSEITIVAGSADALGDPAVLLPAGVLSNRSQPITITDLIKLTGAVQGVGKAGWYGKLHHVKGEETITGNGASINNSASSANGGRATLHVTAITGSWTIKIQESSNDGGGDPFADKFTFTQVTAAGGISSESIEVTGTIEQYTRVTWTEDVAGSITFVVAMARY